MRRAPGLSGWALNPVTSVFIKDTQKTDTEEKTDRGAEGNVKMEAETGKMQSEERRPSPEAGRRQGMESPQEPLLALPTP